MTIAPMTTNQHCSNCNSSSSTNANNSTSSNSGSGGNCNSSSGSRRDMSPADGMFFKFIFFVSFHHTNVFFLTCRNGHGNSRSNNNSRGLRRDRHVSNPWYVYYFILFYYITLIMMFLLGCRNGDNCNNDPNNNKNHNDQR